MNLWLVRHGESTANAGARGETPGGSTLSPLGLEQAEVVGRQLQERVGVPTKILVSAFVRTQQTAAPFVQSLGLEPEVWPIAEWILLDPQRYAGTTQVERQPAVKEFAARLDPFYSDGGDAESFMTFMARVNFFLTVACAWGGNIVAFTHGRFIQGVLWHMQRMDESIWTPDHMRSFWEFSHVTPVENCQVLKLSHETAWVLT